jgi:hypothetical protein
METALPQVAQNTFFLSPNALHFKQTAKILPKLVSRINFEILQGYRKKERGLLKGAALKANSNT